MLLDRGSKEILTMLAENKEPLTAIYIGREFNVSSRTIKTVYGGSRRLFKKPWI
ncbi:HTH domain-containing protein [Tepidimicrobium xylanilyticum]|uniref:HTH domain-containing protein n=1 Tax=Tepidimicrobium xylanilyticum TaxID=1123352 RepID=UPI0037D99B78